MCFSDITGKYSTYEAGYWRIGVGPNCTASDWPAELEIIYICNDIYRVLDWFGCFDGNEYYFKVNEATGRITYPELTPTGDPQSGNGQPFITCESNPGDMTNVPCGTDSNYVERDGDQVRLFMSFGYFTPNSGSREFYQFMEKIIE